MAQAPFLPKTPNKIDVAFQNGASILRLRDFLPLAPGLYAVWDKVSLFGSLRLLSEFQKHGNDGIRYRPTIVSTLAFTLLSNRGFTTRFVGSKRLDSKVLLHTHHRDQQPTDMQQRMKLYRLQQRVLLLRRRPQTLNPKPETLNPKSS